MTYYDYIEKIRKTKGANAKKKVLREALKNEEFVLFCRYCYDYDITFGVRKIDKKIKGDPNYFRPDPILRQFIETIDSFAGRRSDENVRRLEKVLKLASTDEVPYLYNLLSRDMKAGINRSTINTVWMETHDEKLIPGFPLGLCMDYRPNKLAYPLYVEPKMDGIRCVAFVSEGTVTYRSRSGKELDLGDRFNREILVLAGNQDIVFDGELMGADWNSTMNQALRKKNRDLTEQYFHIFDALCLKDWKNQTSDLYSERKNFLAELQENFNEEPKTLIFVEDMLANTPEEMEKMSNDYLNEGFEGVVLKQDEPYPWRGKKDPTWMKYKPWDSFDGIIVGIYEGKRGKNKGRFGGFKVEFDGVVTNVGGGYSDQQRDEYWKVDENEFIGKCVEVIARPEKTPDGKLLFSHFVQFRPDKD